MQIEPSPNVAQVDAGDDAYLVEQVLEQRRTAQSGAVLHDIPISEQLAALRAELGRLSESVGLIAEEATAIVAQAPARLRSEGEQQFYKRPVFSLLAIGILSFQLTRAIFGSSPRMR